MSAKDSSKGLYMKHEVSTKLHEEKKTRETERMAARVKLEETKMIKRRAQQEQQLALRTEKKRIFTAAKAGEAMLAEACEDLETTIKIRTEKKRDAAGVEAAVIAADDKVIALAEKLAVAKATLRSAIKEQDKIRAVTDGAIVEQQSQRLREAWTNSREAWKQVQKAVFKEKHDRPLKKRAKGLLGL